MANAPQSGGFWGSSFSPDKLQQGAQQWGQGLRSAFTTPADNGPDYSKQLAQALLGGSFMGMMPQAVQQRAQDWFGMAPQATPAPTTPAPASARPATGSPSPVAGPPAGEVAFDPSRQAWNEQLGAFTPNGSPSNQPATGMGVRLPQQFSSALSQFGARTR